MIRIILLAGAATFALGGPAIGQVNTAPAGDAAAAAAQEDAGAAATAPADTAAPAPDAGAPAPDTAAPAPDTASPAPDASGTADTSASTTAPTDATQPAAPAPAASASTAPAVDPAKAQKAAATVQADWAKYDKGNKGSLTPLEFGTWVLAASGQDMSAQVEKSKTGKQANLPAVKVLNATAAEFSKADKDHNRAISPDELTAYLSA